VLACTNPRVVAYDPAYAYEIAEIIRDGIRNMYERRESLIYYLTVGNETYPMPPMPKDAEEGILRGMYRCQSTGKKKAKARVHVLGSGAILNEARRAQEMLEAQYDVAADVWSVTSYQQLFRQAAACERWNRLHPGETPRVPYVTECLDDGCDAVVAASDYSKILMCSVAGWIPAPFAVLGTDGFGRSDTREALRDFFEVDARHIVLACLAELARGGKLPQEVAAKALKQLNIDPEKVDPMTA
jgi:pyruvate dehydrogenase E1 component